MTIIPYNDNGIELEGFVAYPEDKKRPLVILCHAWRGRDDFICEKALVKTIYAKILVLHGYNDPVTPQTELLHFANEMNDLKVDWQAHIYGNTMHAFATPSAHEPESGILYNPLSARRAWLSIHNFIDETFN